MIFDEANIICASPKGAGNKKHEFRRIVLALSCVATVRKEYSIDGNRIYVGGLTGGGIMSFLLHFLYPDVFKGAISHARGVCLERVAIPDEKILYERSQISLRKTFEFYSRQWPLPGLFVRRRRF